MKLGQKTLYLMLALVIVTSLIGVVTAPASPSTAAVRLHPLVAQIAAQTPARVISVIVQKADGSDQAEALVAKVGGNVTQDLSMINAFAAEMTAEAAREVATNAAVRWVSLDAPVERAQCAQCVDTGHLIGTYVQSIGAPQLWNEEPYLQGQGVTVAVVDSGVFDHDDLGDGNGSSRVVASVNARGRSVVAIDRYGHGTHVAGIIGGDGYTQGGQYIGVAPKVNIVSVKVTSNVGSASISDVVSGLQWVYDNKDVYNIRVVNVSLNSTVVESYHTSPLNAALEILWFNSIVVVVSAGNNGLLSNGILYPPSNDPFVISAGAVDDQGTAGTSDDVLASYSAYGLTAEGFAKPDLVAPGSNIVSLQSQPTSRLAAEHRDHLVYGRLRRAFYFRMSGTSMAAAITSGAAALLLQDEPNLTPDQVKYRLMATARPLNGPAPGAAGAGYLDIYAAVHGDTADSANTGVVASQLLWTGDDPATWSSVAWNSVAWNSVAWNSVAWNSVAWNSVAWNSVSWEE